MSKTSLIRLTLITTAFTINATVASAQLSTSATSSPGLVTPTISTSSGTSGPSGNPPRFRTIVNLYWHDTPPVIVPRRVRTPHVTYAPLNRTVTMPALTPAFPIQNSNSGLSTALPNWKIATSVLPSTSTGTVTTGHTTYVTPPVISTYDVITPRRRFSYGISFIRNY